MPDRTLKDTQPMLDYSDLLSSLQHQPSLARWAETLPQQIAAGLNTQRYGDLPTWLEALRQLPNLEPNTLDLLTSVTLGSASDLSREQQQALRQALEQLIPWRKGPYEIYGLHLDTEWRSDWKWQRLLPHMAPLHNRLVLDVGCGNGYHGWRMLGAGARRVIGIDPSPRFVVQWAAIKKLAGGKQPLHVLPLGIEQLPEKLEAFDTTFSMGVFYHRRSPMDHLRELKETLRPGGQLVLETLVIEGGLGQVLVPENRYAMMNNVWFLPSPDTLIHWLKKCGFHNPRVVDVSPTSTDEQRRTEWMRFHSLAEFLDPQDPTLTCEGYPAPIRGIFLAEA